MTPKEAIKFLETGIGREWMCDPTWIKAIETLIAAYKIHQQYSIAEILADLETEAKKEGIRFSSRFRHILCDLREKYCSEEKPKEKPTLKGVVEDWLEFEISCNPVSSFVTMIRQQFLDQLKEVDE